MALDSAMRTVRDMRRLDNRQDALRALDRCSTEGEYAAWAKTFGRPLLEATIAPQGFGAIPNT